MNWRKTAIEERSICEPAYCRDVCERQATDLPLLIKVRFGLRTVSLRKSKIFMQPLSSSASEPTPRETSALRRDLKLLLFVYKILQDFKIAGVHVEGQFIINGRRNERGVNLV